MKISVIKKQSLEAIKKDKSIIGYTILYIAIISMIGIILRCVSDFALNNLFAIFSVTTMIVKIISDLLNVQFKTAYVNMLISENRSFKRFFSFFHKKYLSYYLMTALVIYVPYGMIYMLFDSFKETNIPAARVFALINLLLSEFVNIMVYFKASDPDNNFKGIFKQSAGFVADNIFKIILFYLSFIGWYIAEIFLTYTLFVVFGIDTDNIILTSSLCGLGVMLFPYYILSFHYMVRE